MHSNLLNINLKLIFFYYLNKYFLEFKSRENSIKELIKLNQTKSFFLPNLIYNLCLISLNP